MAPDSIFDALQDPQMRHAAIVHMPVALAFLGLIPAALCAIMLGKQKALRWMTLCAYLLLIGAAVFGVRSGEDADHALPGTITPAAHETLEEHEHMAEKVWMFALGTAVLTAATFFPGVAVRGTCSILALVCGVMTAGWVGQTAHHGGSLVYVHRVVAPKTIGAADGARATTIDESSDPRMVHFRAHVLPVFEQSCTKCHNPARKRRSGNLDQTTMAGILQGGIGGPALVPGDPDASLIIQAVRGDDPEFHMPPKEEFWLTPEQISAFEQWVRDGAVWVDPVVPPSD